MIYQPHMEKSDWSEFTTMVQEASELMIVSDRDWEHHLGGVEGQGEAHPPPSPHAHTHSSLMLLYYCPYKKNPFYSQFLFWVYKSVWRNQPPTSDTSSY